MRKLLLLLAGFLMYTVQVYAQTTLSGVVRNNETKQGISDVICTVTNTKGTSFLGFGLTNAEGKYSVTVKSALDSLRLSISIMGYKPRVFVFANASRNRDVLLAMDAIQLKEVVVKSPPIWKKGDTLTYNVGALKAGQDRYIGDVIKKLPGIEVNKTGGITYQGKAINKFYIEGLDLLEDKYGIATNNIPVDAIERVQVFENHQPVKALKDVGYSDQAALNLLLKDGSKMRPVGNVEVGTGGSDADWLFMGKIFGMLISKERQTMVTLKANNTGNDISRELTSQALNLEDVVNGIPAMPEEMLNPTSAFVPTEIEDRALFNQTYLATFNNLLKLNDKLQLRTIANYLNDTKHQDYVHNSSYALGTNDSILNLYETNALRRVNHQAEVMVNLTANASEYYLDNSTKLLGKWSEVKSAVSGTMQNEQLFQMPLYFVHNNLKLIRQWKKQTFAFYSFLRYTNQPQRLSLQSPSEASALEQAGLLKQTVNKAMFYTVNTLSVSRSVGHSVFQLEGQFKADLESMKSGMGDAFFPNHSFSYRNELSYNRWEYQLTPGYVLKQGNFNMKLSAPVTLLDLYTDNEIAASTGHSTHYLFCPSASLRYTLPPFWELSLSGRYDKQVGDMMNYADGLRFTNYQNLFYGSGILEKRESQSYVFRASYRNQIDALFFYLTAIYRPSTSNVVSGRDFIGDYSIQFKEEGTNKREMYIVNGSFAKYIDSWKTNVNLSVGYSGMKFNQYQQQVFRPVSSQLYNVGCKIDVKIQKWSSLMIDVTGVGNQVKTDEYRSALLLQWKSVADWYFFWNDWQLKVSGEYGRNELAHNQHNNLFMLDASLKYKLNRWELSLDWNNMLNKKHYTLLSYDGVNTNFLQYQLRPMQVLASVSFKL